VFNSADSKFSKHFGFSLEEVAKFIPDDPSISEKIKAWYHGYTFGDGGLQVFNPFSFMRYVASGEFEGHRTGNALGKRFMGYLEPYLTSVIRDLFTLMNGGKIIVRRFNHIVNYEMNEIPFNEIWHILVMAGFLTYQANNDPDVYGGGTVFIPNIEVADQWHTEFIQSFQNILAKEENILVFFEQFQKSLSNFDESLLQHTMQEFLNLVYSSGDQREDTQTAIHYENVYHTFFLSAFKATFASEHPDHVQSYREPCNGVFSISIKFPGADRKWVIFEFKRSFTKEALSDDAKIAHQQVIDRNDSSWLHGYDVWLIGISFNGSEMYKLVTTLSRRNVKKEYIKVSSQ
jgi:hypothetical protein